MAVRAREAERGNMKPRRTPPHTRRATSSTDRYTQLHPVEEEHYNELLYMHALLLVSQYCITHYLLRGFSLLSV